MRIISGDLRGSTLYITKDKTTRPLKDMVRESIFNLLIHSNKISFQLEQSNVLDLYSGTGSFGLECVSRGAAEVAFIEKDKKAIKILEKNTAKRSEVFRLVLEKIPLFLLTIGLSIVTVHLQKIAGAVASLDVFPLQARLTNAIVSYLEYLGKMIWPSGLSILYPHPGNALPVWQGILCGMVLVGITIISIRLIKKAPYFAVGWFWYLGTLVPVIGIFVQAGWQAMADRYAYVPLIGIFIIVAWGLPELMTKWRYKKKALVTLAVIVIPLAIMTTWVQVSYWKNDIILYKHAIDVAEKKYPGLARTHNNLELLWLLRGRMRKRFLITRWLLRSSLTTP